VSAHRPSWRPLLVLCAVLAVVGGAVSCTRQTPSGQGELTWAADPEGGAPYIFSNPANPSDYLGFEVDLKNALARELGRPIEYKRWEFNQLFSGLERGDFSFAMNGLEITPENKTKALFTRPYYVYRLQLVVRAGEKRFASLEEIEGRKDLTIGTLEGSVGARALKKRGIGIREYTDQLSPYKDLAQNAIDGVLLDLPIALYFAKPGFNSPYAQTVPGLKFAGEPVDEGYYGIAVQKGNEALVADLNAALDRLLRSGELERIYTQWGLWNDDQLQLSRAGDVAVDKPEEWSFSRYFPVLLEGAQVTVLLTATSFALAIVIALPLALSRLYGPAALRWLATVYVEFFRGIPVLFLLFFLYYGLPGVAEQVHLPFSLKMNPLYAAILGFGLNYAAYEAEIYRAGISSIPAGQWEAAASLGMSSPLTFRRIILPQTIRVILPPMTNDLVALFKDTSVVSVISVYELSKEYQVIVKSGGGYVEIALVTAALYLIMSVPLGYLSRYLERTWGQED
jgi:polar amino acid transport system substrate-binding protein